MDSSIGLRYIYSPENPLKYFVGDSKTPAVSTCQI